MPTFSGPSILQKVTDSAAHVRVWAIEFFLPPFFVITFFLKKINSLCVISSTKFLRRQAYKVSLGFSCKLRMDRV